jgi:hypothetical protein
MQIAEPACAACHQLTDPLGYTLEHYDVLGRFRTTDNGLPVDSAAVIHDLDPMTVVENARGLGNALADSCAVQTCVARTFLAHVLGRPVVELNETAGIEVTRAFAAANLDLRALLLAAVQDPGFVNP